MKKIITITVIIFALIAVFYVVFQILRVQDIVLRKWFFPKEYSEYVERYSEAFQVDPLLIYAIIKAESGFDSQARSRVGAMGLMQVMEGTGLEVAEIKGIELEGAQGLYEPAINIKIGIAYLKSLIELFERQ